MSLAFLVLLALDGGEGGTVLVLAEAFVVIQIEDQAASSGLAPLTRAHAANGEGACEELVANLH